MLVHMKGFDPRSPSWLQWLSTLLLVASVVAHYLTGEDWTIAGLLAGTALLFIGEFIYSVRREGENTKPQQDEDSWR
jgi:hypothetical protein